MPWDPVPSSSIDNEAGPTTKLPAAKGRRLAESRDRRAPPLATEFPLPLLPSGSDGVHEVRDRTGPCDRGSRQGRLDSTRLLRGGQSTAPRDHRAVSWRLGSLVRPQLWRPAPLIERAIHSEGGTQLGPSYFVTSRSLRRPMRFARRVKRPRRPEAVQLAGTAKIAMKARTSASAIMPTRSTSERLTLVATRHWSM
jgi:hypothetical protein